MPGAHTYQFDVTMTCGGCSGAVDRILKRLDGVDSYDVSLDTQRVTVTTDLPFEAVLAKIAKSGKTINSATADGVAVPVEVPAAAA